MRMNVTAPSISVDESAHPGVSIEWWFIQGFFEDTQHGTAPSGRRDFMCCFFRKSVANSPAPGGRNGHMMLQAMLDGESQVHLFESRLDPELIRYYLRLSKGKGETERERLLLDAFTDEIARYGPPRPIRTETAPVTVGERPLRISWKEFKLSQTLDGFELAFREPGTSHGCRFHLRPQQSRFHLSQIKLSRSATMEYTCYPRMELEGTAGRQQVHGEAWFDHQWGNLGWFVSGMTRERILGWNWFGINLDDGSDLMVMLHRNMRTGRPLSHYAVYLKKDRSATLFTDVRLRRGASWESPATRIRYPISWRILIPGLAAELYVSPRIEDQEIPILGATRAIWEGTGSVTGTIGACRVSGRSRLELHGYGTLLSVAGILHDLTRRIDRRISAYMPPRISRRKAVDFVGRSDRFSEPQAYSEVIARPFWDLMSRRGKRWRAIFFILLLQALDVDPEAYEELAAVLAELPHSGSLIIDDIEDGSPIRRGNESIHFRYGLDVAINSANTLYFLPYLLLQRHPRLSEGQRCEIYHIVNRQFVRAHFGQSADIFWSMNLNLRNLETWSGDSLGAKILESYAQKTSALVMGIAETACVIAGVAGPLRRECIAFARDFGVAFQIVDDVLNFSAPDRLRKKEGEDLARGKMTFVIHRALQQLPRESRQRLANILCRPALRVRPEILQEGKTLIRRSGALEYCREESWRMVRRRWRSLSHALPPSDAKTMLRILCSSLVQVSEDSFLNRFPSP